MVELLSKIRWAPERLLHRVRRRAADEILRQREQPTTLLVVCHGNICRSPFAERALRRALASSPDVSVESAGFYGPGRPAPAIAMDAAQIFGVDLSSHRSRLVTAACVDAADLILTMDAMQARAIEDRFGRRTHDVILLGDLDPDPIATRNIRDPFDQSIEVFHEVYARIERCIGAFTGSLGADRRSQAAHRMSTALSVSRHHFTVDVEEYFQVSAFEGAVRRSDWGRMERRVPVCLPRMLDMLQAVGGRGTFFVLGWVAEHMPDTVREIARAGHEVASHGWDHQRVTTQRPEEFRASVRQTKNALEDLTGAPVLGFRAPSYSITPGHEWALDILIEEGYRYDSSLYPIRRPDGYGYPGANPFPHLLTRPSGQLMEVPPTTLRRLGVSLPAAGGAYFRVLPYSMVHKAFKDCERMGVPGTFYIHPWELDPDRPRIAGPWLSRMRHYTGLTRTEERLQRLLKDFQFCAIADTVAPQ